MLLSRVKGHFKYVQLCPVLSRGVAWQISLGNRMRQKELLSDNSSMTNCIYGLPWKCLKNSWAPSSICWPVHFFCSSELWFFPARGLMRLLEGRGTFGNFWSVITIAVSVPVQWQIIWTNYLEGCNFILATKSGCLFLAHQQPIWFKSDFWLTRGFWAISLAVCLGKVGAFWCQ